MKIVVCSCLVYLAFVLNVNCQDSDLETPSLDEPQESQQFTYSTDPLQKPVSPIETVQESKSSTSIVQELSPMVMDRVEKSSSNSTPMPSTSISEPVLISDTPPLEEELEEPSLSSLPEYTHHWLQNYELFHKALQLGPAGYIETRPSDDEQISPSVLGLPIHQGHVYDGVNALAVDTKFPRRVSLQKRQETTKPTASTGDYTSDSTVAGRKQSAAIVGVAVAVAALFIAS